jgi:hypothetical protein
MFARKVLAGVVLAGLAGAAMAQSINGKTDVFNRPIVNQTALQVYEQADPLGLLPQQGQPFDQSKVANPVSGNTDVFGRAFTGTYGLEALHSADPFSPVPQFWGHEDDGNGVVATKLAAE